MTRRRHTGLLVLVFGLAILSPGCGEDNSKAAKITGTVPTDGLTDQQRKEKTKGITKPQDYNPSTPNRRKN